MIQYKWFMRKYKKYDTRMGDLARDIVADKDFPKVIDFWIIERYLLSRTIEHKVMKIFYISYYCYLKKCNTYNYRTQDFVRDMRKLLVQRLHSEWI